MGRAWRNFAGFTVFALIVSGVSGIGAPTTEALTGCTVTLTTQATWTGTDSPETVCIDGTGDYTVDTGGGNDVVKVTDVAASVDVALGDGNDSYAGTLAVTSTVEGGPGNDRVTTGSGDDTVDGGSGTDVIATKAGDDTVIGGDDADRIVTGDGADTVESGAGDDKVSTQNGADTVTAGDGADNINGGAGDDTLDGGTGLDKVAGSTGDDDLTGGPDADKITGGAGNDTLRGGAGDDAIAGSDGIDAISGGEGTDAMSGGTGDDAFDGSAADAATSGPGDSACSNTSQLELTCAYGAVVASVDSTAVPTDAGWRVTVRARALDFTATGVTEIALAESATTSPWHNSEVTGDPAAGLYLSEAPTLVEGTYENGVFESTFDLAAAPTSGRLGVRVFTNGFHIDSYAICVATCAQSQPAAWPCISSFVLSDAECGPNSAMGTVVVGFPKAVRPVSFASTAPSDPTLVSPITLPTDGSLSPPTVTGGGLNGWVLVPRQTVATDRAWVVFSKLPTCAELGAGAFMFDVRAFSVVAGAWYVWSGGTPWSVRCAGSLLVSVSATGIGSGVIRSDQGLYCTSDAGVLGGTCGTMVPLGRTVTMRAQPSAGSEFAGWTGGGCSGTGTCTVTVDHAVAVSAAFTAAPHPLNLTVTRDGSGSGTVASSFSEIDCGMQCSAALGSVVNVTLHAEPSAGSVFAGWSGGGCSGLGTCEVVQSGDVEVAAHFATSMAARRLVGGMYHRCVLSNSGAAKCWGSNWQGALGLGNAADRGDTPDEMGDALPIVDVGTGATITDLSAGWYSTCALLDGGSVKCWGWNTYGQLGLGDTESRGDDPGEMGDSLATVGLGTGRHAVQIASGATHSCAILDDGSVKCWGAGFLGELGSGDESARGDGPNEMGDNLPVVDLGQGRHAVRIAAGVNATCAILDDGSVKCWGAGGMLGLGDIEARGDGPNEMGDNLPPVDLGTGRTARDISVGWDHVCALLDNAKVKCWGANDSGQLGLGNTAARGDQPGEMGDNLPAVDLGTGRSAIQVSAGAGYACAVLDDGMVKCWGNNEMATLGLGDSANRGDQPREMGDRLSGVEIGQDRTASSVLAGDGPTCALLDGGTVKCWGWGGPLGYGDWETRGDGPYEMGDFLPTVPV